MPNATALLTSVLPDLSDEARREAELAFASSLYGFEAGSLRQRPHGTIFRADEGALLEIAADAGIARELLLRVYLDVDGEAVRIGTRTAGPGVVQMKKKGAAGEQAPVEQAPVEQGEPGEGEPPPQGFAARNAGETEVALWPSLSVLYIEAGEPWSDWIVQLWVPPHPVAVADVESTGVRVVGTVGRFGLHVRTPTPVTELNPAVDDVRWVEPYHPVLRIQPELLDPALTGQILDKVAIQLDPPEALASVRAALVGLGAHLGPDLRAPALADGQVRQVVARLPADAVAAVARLPGVAWIQYAPRTPKPESEREAQVVAGNIQRSALKGPASGEVASGYRGWLHRMGLSGAGTTIAICDTGVAWNQGNARRSAPDLDRRQVAAFDYTNGLVHSDTWGHGTHIAGLAVGSGIRAASQPGAPLSLGLGVAPGASYVTQNAIAEPPDPDQCGWWPPTTLLPYTRDASRAGATILTMAWTTDAWFVGQGYVPLAAELDGLVRDPADTSAPGGEMVVVASAGNVVGAGPSTITPPKEAKNIVVVGASTRAPDAGSGEDGPGPDGIATFSARGPALDGRLLPTVVAPGVDVVSTLSRTAEDPALLAKAVDLQGLAATAPEDVADAEYAPLSGTSMAVGLVAGACALLDEWWRSWGDNAAPRADLTRALLVIGADDLSTRLEPNARVDFVRPGPIPDFAQGWGRVNVGNVVRQAPSALQVVQAERLRGPKRVERGDFHLGDAPHRRRYARARADLPVRATLAWTDAPGSTGKSPALCNDLDLTVTTPDGSQTWSGNHFEGGWSAPGRVANTLDNLECVFLRHPPDVVEVSVEPSSITADARPPYSLHTPWQDYALVLENLVPVRGDAKAIALLDRSTRMGHTGALAALGQGWQGFVRGLRRGDAVGLVRFDDDARVVFPAQAGDPIPVLLAPDDDDRYCAGVASTPTGSESRLLAGLKAARTVEQAPLVLLSDGAFPDVTKALASWGGRAPIHTVGLWPVAAETTLRAIAQASHGRYLYAPTEALLGASMAELRAELTGDAVIRSEVVNVGGPAPQGTLAIPVEDGAEGLLVAITWGEAGVSGVQGPPKDASSLGITLRTPDGHRLPAWSSVTAITTGPGSVHLEIGRLRPGRWVVELELRRAAPLAVHVAASVPPGAQGERRLRAHFWPPRPRTGEPLHVIARWSGVPGLDPQQANVSGVVERPYAKAALNRAHRRIINTSPPVPASEGGRDLRAREHIRRAEGVDIFAPITEPLDFRWVPFAADGKGAGWQALVSQADLPFSWSAQVSGWVIAPGRRRFVRAARACTVVRGPPILPPRIVEANAPTGQETRGPWFRPGEEVDIGDCGFTARGVWLSSGASSTRSSTSGAAHLRATSTTDVNRTLGHLVALGGSPSPFPLVLDNGATATHVAPTNGGTLAESYPVGKDNWLWSATDEWPDAFDLVQGDWSLPAINADWKLHSRSCDAFPLLNASSMTAPAAGDRVYRMKVQTTTGWVTIGFLIRNTNSGSVTWWIDPTLSAWRQVTLSGATKRVLRFTSGGTWRFEVDTVKAQELTRPWAKLTT